MIVGVVAAVGVLAALAPSGAWPKRVVRQGAAAAALIATAALLAAPAAWSATTWQAPVNGVFPGAGPSFVSGGFGGPRGSDVGTGVDAALAYAESHGAGTRFGLVVSSEQEAAPYVIRGESVASMGGFTGRETVLTHSYLASLVGSGEARYFLLGGQGGFGGPLRGTNNAAVSTIESVCKAVPSGGWSGTLYDCAGKADAILAAS